MEIGHGAAHADKQAALSLMVLLISMAANQNTRSHLVFQLLTDFQQTTAQPEGQPVALSPFLTLSACMFIRPPLFPLRASTVCCFDWRPSPFKNPAARNLTAKATGDAWLSIAIVHTAIAHCNCAATEGSASHCSIMARVRAPQKLFTQRTACLASCVVCIFMHAQASKVALADRSDNATVFTSKGCSQPHRPSAWTRAHTCSSNWCTREGCPHMHYPVAQAEA
eukprot:1159677-Pelagomonas_calceolata.AAC.7